MKMVFELLFMILQSLSVAIIDVFYFMTAFVGFMTIFRFGQFGVDREKSIKRARDLTIEYGVQGILIGALLSCVVVYLGMPVVYSEYLYFLLPLSFVLGFYHIRFTNLIYAASMMALLGLALNGQTIGGQVMPDIGINPSSLALVTGLLMILIGLLMMITGTRNLMPIAAKDGERQVVGFASQRFWPVPLVLLAALQVAVRGETVEMPNWWPALNLAIGDGASVSLFLLPLLLIVSHGSVSFVQKPLDHIRFQYVQQIAGGVVLTVVGYFGSRLGHMEMMVTMSLLLVAALPEVYWHYKELASPPSYTLEDLGVTIIGVKKRSLASEYGFEIGDCIKSINGTVVKDWGQLGRWAKVHEEASQVQLLRLSREYITIDLDHHNLTEVKFGLMPMLNKPEKFYHIEDINHMNMMHLMRFNRRKDDSA